MTALNSSKNRCELCGRFLATDDVYGDFHTSNHHPEEYAAQMERFRRAQAQNVQPHYMTTAEALSRGF